MRPGPVSSRCQRGGYVTATSRDLSDIRQFRTHHHAQVVQLSPTTQQHPSIMDAIMQSSSSSTTISSLTSTLQKISAELEAESNVKEVRSALPDSDNNRRRR